jgi:hypothetical protein
MQILLRTGTGNREHVSALHLDDSLVVDGQILVSRLVDEVVRNQIASHQQSALFPSDVPADVDGASGVIRPLPRKPKRVDLAKAVAAARFAIQDGTAVLTIADRQVIPDGNVISQSDWSDWFVPLFPDEVITAVRLVALSGTSL